VSMGTNVELKLLLEKGLMNRSNYEVVIRMLTKYGLPIEFPSQLLN